MHYFVRRIYFRNLLLASLVSRRITVRSRQTPALHLLSEPRLLPYLTRPMAEDIGRRHTRSLTRQMKTDLSSKRKGKIVFFVTL